MVVVVAVMKRSAYVWLTNTAPSIPIKLCLRFTYSVNMYISRGWDLKYLLYKINKNIIVQFFFCDFVLRISVLYGSICCIHDIFLLQELFCFEWIFSKISCDCKCTYCVDSLCMCRNRTTIDQRLLTYKRKQRERERAAMNLLLHYSRP